MRRLTKKEALLHCYDLWHWCAETGEDKENWPGWKHNGGKFTAISYCFACEYNKQNVLACYYCIMRSVWGAHSCNHPNSLFEKWRRSQSPDAKKYAREIADGALKLYNEVDT